MGLFVVPNMVFNIFSCVVKNNKKLIGGILTFLVLSYPLQTFAEESVQINLRNVEIPALIETVSKITGKSFVVDPRVKGRVTVITPSGSDANEIYETFLSVLQVHGFSAVPSGNLIKIVPSNKAKQQPVPVVEEDVEKGRRKPKKRSADELITRVIRVEHVPAAMLVPILRPLVPSTGQLQAYGPSNTIVISDRAANIDRLVKVIKRMDRADDEELEVIPLKYASAKELAQTIQILQRSSIKGAASKNKISADSRTNSLLLSGDKSSRQQVRKIIKKLDTFQTHHERTKVIYLRYAKATDLVRVLAGFSKTQKTTKGTKKGAAGTQSAAVDIQADAATNSLIITADPDVQKNLARVIHKLDLHQPKHEKTKVIYLRYAKATDLVKVLTGFSKTQKTTKATTKGAAGTQKADIDIQADEATNSLIITAEPDAHKNLTKVIRKLDVRRAQVLVEAIIAEVSADLSKNLGIQLGTGAADNGKNVGFGILSTFASAGASVTSAGKLIPAGDGATFGFALGSNGNINFGLLMNALAGDAATNILSTPTLIALDNQEAKIVVGKNVPFLTGQYSNTGGGSSTPSNPFQTIERKDVGITLKIKPQINDGSSIRLDIEQEISSLAASDVSTSDVVTNKRMINTSVMVEDGQVLVLGGLIEDTYTDTEQKVPLLGDLPVIGRAFRNNKTIKKKQNLMVFIHPVIMRDVLSGDEYTRQKYNKLKHAQSTSNIAKRGLLKSGAVFPDNIRRDLVKKMTPAQKKQLIIREQQQRVLAHKQKIRQAKQNQLKRNRMAQQRRAATAQARSRTPRTVVNPAVRAKAIKAMPQRLRNIVPHTKSRKPVSRFNDVFDMDSGR